MYAVLSGLSLRSSREPLSLRTLLLTILGVSILGAVDEWHQAFIPGRSMSFLDWIADSTGALVGALATRYLLFLPSRRRAPIT